MALSCFDLAKGIDSRCDLSVGGVKEVILVNMEVEPKVETTTITDAEGLTAETFDEVTEFSGATSANTYDFTFKKNTASMTSDLQTGDSNYIQTQITMQFSRMDGAKRMAMNSLILAEVRAVVADSNGRYWLVGHKNEVFATASQGTTGQNRSDFGGYSITLQGEETEYPIPVSATAWQSLKAVAK